MDNIFAERRVSDPQECIDDLIGQTARQAKAIHELNNEVATLKEEVDYLRKGNRDLALDAPF